MRTKILVGAAALAAGALTSMAQSNVYSLNVVGYVNLPLTQGFNLVANQLDADGTGTNNTIQGVFGSLLPPGSTVYTWNGAGYNVASYTKNKAGTATNWSGNYPLNPGQGSWVSIPTGTIGTNVLTVTTVGQVLQGAAFAVNPYYGTGFSLLSSVVPLSGGLVTTMGYTPAASDTVYTWNGTGYNVSSYTKNKAGTATTWSNGEPQLSPGEGFWLNSTGKQAWSNYFQVN